MTSQPNETAAEGKPSAAQPDADELVKASTAEDATASTDADSTGEYGGPKGPGPTRYGDWEKAGRCIDF